MSPQNKIVNHDLTLKLTNDFLDDKISVREWKKSFNKIEGISLRNDFKEMIETFYDNTIYYLSNRDISEDLYDSLVKLKNYLIG